MIVLTNCLTKEADEGGLKVAHSLAERIKRLDEHAALISYGQRGELEDIHLNLNKLMLSRRLSRILKEKGENVLYMPQYARMLPMALRTFILSRCTPKELWVLLSMKSHMGWPAKCLLRWSRAKVIAVSNQSWLSFREIIGENAHYLRTGVDTARFSPVSEEKKRALRVQYGIPEEKTVVLHVGHMVRGRNIAGLAELDERFHGVLVVSTKMREQWDAALSEELRSCPNVTVIDTYIPRIEEIYQMADVYLFPVMEEMNCIDVPLSALEAASCGIPVVATKYGELSELIDHKGFYHITSFNGDCLNELLDRAAQERENPRESVLAYDWNASAARLIRLLNA